MSTVFNPSFLVWLIVVIVPVTLITTYTITEVLHADNQIIPFISSSINNAPESCIGGFGLSITSFIMILIVLVKYLVNKSNIINYQSYDIEFNEKGKLKFNKFIASMGIISAISLNGVAAFQYKNAHVVHLTFATLFFLCGFIFIITQTILDDKVSNNTKRIKNLRKVLICLTSLFVVYVILQFVQIPITKNLSAIFEITSASCIFIYMVSFVFEFSKMNLNIELTGPLLSKNSGETTSITTFY